MFSAPTGSAGISISAISCSTGSGVPIWQLTISIVRSTGRLATGTSVSIAAILTVTISTSGVRTSMLPIAADMPGIFMADMATTTDAESTSVHPQERTSACTTVGIVVTSAHLTTALHASQQDQIMAIMEVGSAAMPQVTIVQ